MSNIDSSFYHRSGMVKDSNRTYVPDLYRQCAEELRAEEQEAAPQTSRTYILQQRPIVGVLFSISAGSDGELFPLYIGRNLVGRDETCDVCLRESTVSSSHATVLARRQFDENGEEVVRVAITDNCSTCGTKLNGVDLGYDKVFCHNGDIITVGENYQLLLTLFDAADRLQVSPNFERIPDVVPAPPVAETSVPDDTVSNRESATLYSNHSENTTVCMDSDNAEFYRPSSNKNQDHYNNKTILV